MFKRISISSTTLAAFILAMIGLFPVIAAAQAPDEPQQKAAVPGGPRGLHRSDGLVVELKKASGEKAASCRLTHVNNSDGETAFDCGVPPDGDYVLTVTTGDVKLDSVLNLIRRVIVTGPVGGTIDKEWKLEAKAADATSAKQPLGSVSNNRKSLSILLKADGNTRIAGKIKVGRMEFKT